MQVFVRSSRFTVDEHLVYGSSRLGVRKNGLELLTYVPNTDPVKHPRGLKRYELSDHLGNVHTVLSDRRNRICGEEYGGVSHYEPDILLTYDYYAFGMMIPERSYKAEICSSYTVTGTVYNLNENFTNLSGSFTTYTTYPWAVSPAAISGSVITEGGGNKAAELVTATFGTAIWRWVTPPTSTACTLSVKVKSTHGSRVTIHGRPIGGSGSPIITSQTLGSSSSYVTSTLYFTPISGYEYWIAIYNWGSTGTTATVIFDDMQIYYTGDIPMTGCDPVDNNEYRFLFNGQEKDDEVYGEGNSYTAEYWQYDPRLGRRWNMDPITTVSSSPYEVNGSNPIYYTDPRGDFKTEFGAWLYRLFHGKKGDDIYYAAEGKYCGEWVTGGTRLSTSIDIDIATGKVSSHPVVNYDRTVRWGQNRKKNSALGTINIYDSRGSGTDADEMTHGNPEFQIDLADMGIFGSFLGSRETTMKTFKRFMGKLGRDGKDVAEAVDIMYKILKYGKKGTDAIKKAHDFLKDENVSQPEMKNVYMVHDGTNKVTDTIQERVDVADSYDTVRYSKITGRRDKIKTGEK